MIRDALPRDCAAIAAIYNHYVQHTVVTFEEVAVPVDEMGRRVTEIQSRFPWLVVEDAGEVQGYAYAGPWKQRAAYRFAVEISVYLHPAHVGKGLGTALYQHLLVALAALQVHAIIGGVALPNEASVRLHEKFGFIKTAHFADVGFKFGRWVDVAYWQLLLPVSLP
jgi:phosphinothricin acetyltransferase